MTGVRSEQTVGRALGRLAVIGAATCLAMLGLASQRADGASHRARPARSVSDVAINGETVPYLGGYRLDGVSTASAFSLGPGVGAAAGTYTATKPAVMSRRLDALLFLFEAGLVPDDDNWSIAGAALAWWYADTRRPDGNPVWANPADGFAPIDPTRPDWSQLPAYSKRSPVGIKGGGVDFDGAEAALAQLITQVDLYAGPWTMRPVGTDTVRLEAHGHPLPGIPVHYSPPFQVSLPAGSDPPPPMTITDDNGQIDVAEVRDQWAQWAAAQSIDTASSRPTDPPEDDPVIDTGVGAVVERIWVEAPGRHKEWSSDRDGARLATATLERASHDLVVDDPLLAPAATTTTTTTSQPTTTTSVPTTSSTPDTAATTTTTTSMPATGAANTSTTSTTTTTGKIGATTTSVGPAQAVTTPQVAPPTPSGSSAADRTSNIAVPVTGPSRVVGWILRFGDIAILLGVALVVGVEYLPQRKETTAP